MPYLISSSLSGLDEKAEHFPISLPPVSFVYLPCFPILYHIQFPVLHRVCKTSYESMIGLQGLQTGWLIRNVDRRAY